MLDTCFKVGNVKALICSHCNLTGHTVKKCYKLHDYPPSHKLFTKPRGVHVLATQSTSAPAATIENSSNIRIGLIKAQYNQLSGSASLRNLSWLCFPQEPLPLLRPRLNLIFFPLLTYLVSIFI